MKLRFAALLLLLPSSAFGQAERVTDINTSQTGPAAFFGYLGWDLYSHEIASFGSRVAFSADDGIHGNEVWVTDGTSSGTRVLADLCPGRCPSQPHLFRAFEDRLFFVADDGVRGSEPFVTDGTPGGTVALGDFWPGQGTSRIWSAVASSTQIFFVADSPGSGRELWRTDGTAEGTRLVRDLRPGVEGSQIWLLGAAGGSVLFQATADGTTFGLWRSDGTAAGTAPLGFESLAVALDTFAQPTSSAGKVFFVASTAGSGPQLWRSDGSAEGTVPLTAFSTSSLSFLTTWAGQVYFLVQGPGPTALWTSDGSLAGTGLGATLPEGLRASFLNSGPNGLYFSGCDFEVTGCEPWYSNGTAAGTRRIRDLRPGPESGLSAYRPWLGPAGSGFVFLADDSVHGIEPWFSDGTDSGTRLLKDAMPGPDSGHGTWDAYRGFERAALGSRVFFWAADPGHGFELWSSDGTPEGTAPIADVNAMAPSIVRLLPEELFPRLPPTPVPGGLLVFASDHGVDVGYAPANSTGREPWFISHGDDPPVLLGDLVPGPNWMAMTAAVAIPTGAVFLRDRDLWNTDGTPEGTAPVAATAGQTIERLIRLDTRVLVTQQTESDSGVLRALDLNLTALGPDLLATPGIQSLSIEAVGPLAFVSNSSLAVTDGTPEGTRVLDPFLPFAFRFVPLDAQRVLFITGRPETGNEPWTFTDGAETPEPVVDILPGPESGLFPGFPRWESWQFPPFAPIGTQALFGADDGIHGFELWATDGTAPGTRLVRDLHPGATHSDLERITAVGNRAFFVADDGVHGREIWLSDGTAAGTRLLRDLAPGPGSAVPQELTAIGDFLVFNAWTPEHGRELWISDGTEIGTRRLTDLAPGPMSSSPVTFVAAGGWLYFTANDNVTGDELWRLPLSLLQAGTIFADGFESGDSSAWSSASP